MYHWMEKCQIMFRFGDMDSSYSRSLLRYQIQNEKEMELAFISKFGIFLSLLQCSHDHTDKDVVYCHFTTLIIIPLLSYTQPDSHYIRYTAASVMKSTTPCTSKAHWLMCAW